MIKYTNTTQAKKKKIETTVIRGITIANSKLLLCKAIRKENYFLIGGHLERNEQPIEGLKREISEETGLSISKHKKVGEFLNIFESEILVIHEKNIVFSFDFLQEHTIEIKSQEDHIIFSWVPLNQLKTICILPKNIVPIIYESI